MSIFLKRQKVRRQRAARKVMRRVTPFLCALGVLLGGGAVLAILFLYVCFGPTLTVREIAVASLSRHVAPDTIAKLADVDIGSSLFLVNLSAVHERLLANPWIATATVRRRPPHALWISVVEHTPVAVAAVGSRLWYVNEAGELFKEVAGEDDKAYPVLTGMGEGDHQLRAHALDLVRWFTLSRIAGEGDMSEVHYDPVAGFSLLVGRPPLSILVGSERPGWCTERLDRLAQAIRSHQGRIRYIVACDRERVVVKYES